MDIMGVDNSKMLIPSFYDAIFNKPHQVWQPFMEWTENNIDNLIDNPVVNDIPFVSAITNGIKFGLDVRARFLLKKTTLFIEELKSTSVDQEKLDNYRKKVEKNKEYLYRELENVLIYLDKISEPEKQNILQLCIRHIFTSKYLILKCEIIFLLRIDCFYLILRK